MAKDRVASSKSTDLLDREMEERMKRKSNTSVKKKQKKEEKGEGKQKSWLSFRLCCFIFGVSLMVGYLIGKWSI